MPFQRNSNYRKVRYANATQGQMNLATKNKRELCESSPVRPRKMAFVGEGMGGLRG